MSHAFHVKPAPEPASFEELRAHIGKIEKQLAEAKHLTWTRMRMIRDRARNEEAREMGDLRDFAEPLERQIEAMKSAIAEHHADKATIVFVPKADPMLMVF